MPFQLRPRRLARAALTGAVAVLATACAHAPNTIFHSHTEFNREVGGLFQLLIWLGTIVFVFVEGLLVWTLIKYRRRDVPREPEHVHGNTTLEILWTAIPAVILIVIAIPTVRTIFRTQAKARSDALQVEVIGHQWWWEFRYPQYNVITANELYLPIGRTVNFTLHTQDVLHSFWIPQLGGKRDLIANHTNYLWFTPDSVSDDALNGFCAEYCGTSHANMRFRVFTVKPDEFEGWAKNQQAVAAFGVPNAPATNQAAGLTTGMANQAVPGPNPLVAGKGQSPSSQQAAKGVGASGLGPTVPSAGPPGVGVPNGTVAAGTTPSGATVTQAGFTMFPVEQMQPHTLPQTPTPSDLHFDESLKGDPARGAALLSQGQGGCLGCHTIKGNPVMIGQIGPNLTHIATRHTIAAGLYPNDTKHLELWIKNARKMKPGVIMPTLGMNEFDPVLKSTQKFGLTDQQIADIVAYLQALK